jgi:wobble nucleotide-excising tRNase
MNKMIKSITIKDIATFNSGITFEPTLINFIYGSNGSGKTTMSNVLKNCSAYPNCNIDWGLATPVDTLVYNRLFIYENFGQPDELKGIFTLGKDSIDEIEKIKTCKAEIEKNEEFITKSKGSLEEEKEKLNNTENTFTDKCWAVLKKYETIFIKAFEGNRNSKQRFKDKVLSEYTTNKQPLEDYEKLVSGANSILNASAESIPEIKDFVLFDFKMLEENSIFQTRIIGKGDVDIAKMILKLNNSDWVRQGIEYFNSNENYCPFCQQSTTEAFYKQLNEYFDETYTSQIETLKTAAEKYKFESQQLESTIDSYSNLENKFIDKEKILSVKSIVTAICQKNILNLDKKLKEPTVKIEIDSLSEPINKLCEIITQADNKTKEHNNLVKNIDTERRILIAKIWAFVLNELKSEHSTYSMNKDSINKAIKSISDKISATQIEIDKLKIENQTSEQKITSVKPTIDAINKTLSSFGFTNFCLAEASKGNYKIIRENGTVAKNTLSEGEKTFITFLYFYHLTNGSFETDKISNNKIVVIDDPISSLDSSVLFIVSNLVRKLTNDCRTEQNNIKQIFILTHNVYFHKEITYQKQSDKTKGQSFWIVRKIGNDSTIENYPDNPVQTSYDLLWQEIRDSAKINKLTVYNTLRRILEYYFKILGKIKDDDLLNKFDGEDKIISNSLLSWINDGSHSINDDIFVSTDDETVEKYLRVFKQIFEVENQISHYNMMMKVS